MRTLALALLCACTATAQSIGAGTVGGKVVDPSGAVIVGAVASLQNSVTNYRQSARTDENGVYRFNNVPLNSYRLSIAAPGFSHFDQDVTIRSTVPMTLDVTLQIEGPQTTTVDVSATSNTQLDLNPASHSDVDQSLINNLPTTGTGLSDLISLSTPGVVADSNGFFHPQGDHAQTSYVVDGQPISDQQSRAFSTQMPENAFQNMEMITGSAAAQYGDKTSLVVEGVTRSGLAKQPFGEFDADYGSFGTVGEKASFGFGSAKLGNFLVLNSDRTGRFLDSPEFDPMHDVGNDETFFDRIDFQPTSHDALHLNLFGARNWFQIPDSYDEPDQDQRQRVVSFNIAPGYQHTFGTTTLLTINPWVRRDFVNYYPSRDPFDDTPATLSQDRHLLNYGVRADISTVIGTHSLKFGTEIKQTRLFEDFFLGITDPSFNPVCVDANGDSAGPPTLTNPGACAGLGLSVNPNLAPGLVPYDLTRGGSLFHFRDSGKINEYAFYTQDSFTAGNFTFNYGLRVDQYNGLSEKTGIEPRGGISYLLKHTGTVLRLGYSHTMETPYNENLLLSSASGVGGLATNVFGAYASAPLRPGQRNQYNTGLQQRLGKYFLVDGEYFWKFTDTAYDFDVLFDTPVTFPISWRKSKLDGVAARLSTTSIHGFQAFLNAGHTRARFFGPEDGGLIFNSPVDVGVFRIDHDEAYEQTANLRYQLPKNGPWIDFTWRFDSGLVAGSVPDLATALALTADEQAAIGFYCGTTYASLLNRITSCTGTYGATRLVIPPAGTENDDHNPPRVAPHSILDLGIGDDNLLHTEKVKLTAKLSILNLTNEVALYNFLSTFSGTHFVTPRSLTLTTGVVF
ncbi:MAG TPA: TonB-dependent receptor [Bryobacteraceae bacterium]|nr:TonB-dependent receptor [Bryobacteraceae bacterium]